MNFIQRFRNARQDQQLEDQAVLEQALKHDIEDNYMEIPCTLTPPMPPVAVTNNQHNRLPKQQLLPEPKGMFAKCRCLVCSTIDIFPISLETSDPHLRAYCRTCGTIAMHRVLFKYKGAEINARLGHRYTLRKV